MTTSRVGPFALAGTLALLLAPQIQAREPLYEIQGVNDLLGWSVASIGDVDGDTVPDFAAGAPDAGSGEVRVYSGATGEPVAALAGKLVATDGGEFLGRAVAAAGDLNGDDVPDVLVGAPRSSANFGPVGYVKVFSGANGAVLRRIDGATSNEFFGGAVAGVGDVNGDDVPDLLIGAPGVTGGAPGSVRLHSGEDGTLIRCHEAESPTDNLGKAVAALGDVDGDGIGDYAIGAPRFVGSGTRSSGYVKVVSGADGALLANIRGKEGDSLGGALAGPGDLNGDGRPDVLAGGVGIKLRGGVRAYSISGGKGKQILSVVWPFEGPVSFFGSAVAGVGDVTGDGLADIAVGASGPSVAGVLSGRAGFPLFSHVGAAEDIVGDAVASAGDLTGDGIPELLVGAWGSSRVRVFALSEVTPPRKLAATVDLVPAGTGEGTLSVSLRALRVSVKVKVAGLAAGTYAVFAEDGAGLGTFAEVVTVEVTASGTGKVTLKGKTFVPQELGGLSVFDLAGRAVEVRDGGGAVVLSGLLPTL